MRVTSVRVNTELDRSKAQKATSQLIAFVSIVMDDVLVIANIRVIKADTGKLIVSMPSRQSPDGRYKDLAYPINQTLRTDIDKAVIKAVDDALKAVK